MAHGRVVPMGELSKENFARCSLVVIVTCRVTVKGTHSPQAGRSHNGLCKRVGDGEKQNHTMFIASLSYGTP